MKINIIKTEPQEDFVEDVTEVTPAGGDMPPAEEGPICSALGQPIFELNTFKFVISGSVDSSYTLTWERIEQLPVVSTDTLIMYCVEGWEVWGVWKGVLVKDILEKAKLHPNVEYFIFLLAFNNKSLYNFLFQLSNTIY